MTAVGGLTSPVRGPYSEPLYIANKPPDSLGLINSSVNYEDKEEHQVYVGKAVAAGTRTKEPDGEEEEAAESNESKRGSPFCPQALISEPNHKRSNKITTVSELELRKLERGEVPLSLLLPVSSEVCV